MERRNDGGGGSGGKIKIGVCVMEKKVSCSPMEQILERLRAFGEFEIIIFGDKVILQDLIESWPLCDCLIAFYSSGYPLEKAEKYAALRRPFLVNELVPQYLLHDRSKVYQQLKSYGVPVPTYAVVRREYPNQELNYFVEDDDFIEIHGKRFCKPFVEKPIDGDDHKIMIYYPSSAGGGMKELFRKVGNRSSEFYPDVRKVCGFDLLRYYDAAACILRKMFLDEKAPHISSTIPTSLPWKISEPAQQSEAVRFRERGTVGISRPSEELRCVIALIRHGDRTPKQKVKLKVTEEKLLKLMLKYNSGKAHTEAKLKSALQLQDLLDATRILVPRARSGRESDSDVEVEHAEKLRQVRAVLEEGGHFSGIYRKVQLKPSNWVRIPKDNREGEEEYPVEALMVLKYGGVLTHAGRKQAEELGRYFRNNMYPSEGPGLLRLHSTYRHDLKIYSSDEGRVQVSLVSKDSSMLDGLQDGTDDINEAKARLHDIITSSKVANCNEPVEFPWMVDGAGVPKNAAQLLTSLAELTKQITAQVKMLSDDEDEKAAIDSDSPNHPYDQAKALGKAEIDKDRISAGLPCGSESFLLMFARWKKLERDLYNERKKYDLLHNSHLNLTGLNDLFKVSQLLADGVIPNEYGINPKQKLQIGSKVSSTKRKERCYYEDVRNECFERSSSNKKSIDLDDSHKETKYCLDPKSSLYQLFKTRELDYMSYIVLRMFENTEVPLEHPKRFRIEMTFSHGADISSLETGGKASLLPDDHTMPIMEPERLQEVGSYITLDKFDKMTRPFAMPAEDFPPAAPSQPSPVSFCKDIELQGGRSVISSPVTMNTTISGQKLFCICLLF
ncbi:hypothetical protein C2845_PM08G27330 [Panicum miliaceum]|uniref:Inositol hexakisphosphate and diphosphoinositol-pentakisphosphate kinase n=1 Tax=Panicum miliaceum TaxID=4540 RepID=A0A3L6R265_PANMI|nr:hypothetical protein C2845_PM08G27330 [Panicum miliaceum]